MKEIYKVQTPKRIVFGDPLYFEEFSGARLEQLVVDVQPPEAFGARVVLREFPQREGAGYVDPDHGGLPGLQRRTWTYICGG